MGFLLNKVDQSNLTIPPVVNNCYNDGIYFTAEDIVEFKEMLEEFYKRNPNKDFTIEDLVNYFNNKYECNKLVDILKNIVEKGLEIKPKLAFLPITEKCEVTKGKFKLSRKPLRMGEYYFLNNLVLVRYEDGTYDFYSDVKVNEETLICDLGNESINGTCFVSYNYLTNIE